MLQAVIIDDEPASGNALKEKLRTHFPQVQVMAVCNGGGEGIEAVDMLKPDIVFLDIEMPKINGFTLLQTITYKNFELVFTTAYDHYAIRAIRFSALDYLLKPVEIEELHHTIEKAEARRSMAGPNERLQLLLDNLSNKIGGYQRIAIPTAEGLEFIKMAAIIYLEAVGNYTQFFLDGGHKYLVSRTMKEFAELLPADIFLRIHHAHIINKNFTERYIRGEGGQVVLSNGAVLDVSKRKKAEFLKAIGNGF